MVIGIQMVKVGYELPKQYLRRRLVELTICLLPLMAIQWLATSSCILLMVPHLSFVRLSLILKCAIADVFSFSIAVSLDHRILCHLHRSRSVTSHRKRPLC